MNMLKKYGKNLSIFTTINFISIYCYILYKKSSETKLNIVLDLDETIAHTDKQHNFDNFNKSNISKPNLVEVSYKSTTNIISSRVVWIRPGVNLLLPIIAQFNNIYLFTKATKPYADEILFRTNLDKYFKEKKYREECHGVCKDLEKFNIDATKSILIDDKLSNRCGKQNFYHIPRFNCYVKYDYEFFKLFGYILWLNIKNDFGLIYKN